MQLLWVSDIHLDFLKQPNSAEFFAHSLTEEYPEATGLIITGDISTGKLIQKHLEQIAKGWKKAIFFVTGNHDYYQSSFSIVDRKVQSVCDKYNHLHWLNNGWHIHNTAVVIGVNGWYDAYYGNKNSKIELNDFYYIEEIASAGTHRLDAIRERASIESNTLAKMMKVACEESDTIIVCTHVPPYKESAWHEGKESDDDFAPWFSSKSTGMVLDVYAKRYPQKKFIVLTGRSHSPGVFERFDNLVVFTGKAKYGYPELAGNIDVDKRIVSAYDHNKKPIEYNF